MSECDFEVGTKYFECCDVCVVPTKPRGLSRPCLAPHLTNSKLACAFDRYERLPFASYPPGRAPTGGDPDLRISSEELARRARNSQCDRCQMEVDVKEAAKLQVDWRFWVGCGLGALGGAMLLMSRKA